MPESATQPQSDTPPDTLPADTQPVVVEPLRPQEEEPPPARWRVSRSALLLIGGPLAGALLVWLLVSIFSADPEETLPAAVTEAPAPQPAVETPQVTEPSVANSADAEPAPVDPEPVEPEPAEQPDAPLSAINDVTPEPSRSALDTIRGTVRVSVRVTIDKEGAVVDATPDDPGPSRYFERLSVAAAKKWTFTPSSWEDQRTMLVKFNFTREGVTAQADPDEESDLTLQP